VGLKSEERSWHPCDRERPHLSEREQFVRALRETFPARALGVALETADVAAPAVAQLAEWSRVNADGIAVVAGPTGVGKTVAACWLALQQPLRSRPAFLRASEFAALSRYDSDARARWSDPSWLVLDDVGAEFADAKGSFAAALDELVDLFYAHKRVLVMTTNLTSVDFAARCGERITDRLREAGAWIAIASSSLRGRADR
jgi:DNA replication protein DnaC